MEELPSTGLFILLSVVAFFCYLYYMIWQSYVLLFDIVLSAVGVFILFLELVLGSQMALALSRE